MAKLYFRYGAMNSGKSSALLQVAHNYEERGQEVIVIKPSVDLKGSDSVVSRVGGSRKVDILATPDLDLYELIKKHPPFDCILVDEAQFLEPKQVDQLFALTLREIPVIAFGLKVDFSRNFFPGSSRLFELAHSLEELKTICRCGSKATFNGRQVNKQWVYTGDQVVIDNNEDEVIYEALCGRCYDFLVKSFV